MDKNLSFKHFFLTTMPWNLSVLTTILLNLNQSSTEIRSSTVLSAALILFSSANFNRFVFVIQRYRSFVNILKRSGLGTEPLRTLDNSK